jgi:DMSO/TMAO reductase YedYZ molybdopterin-dependent catalytic subunit
MPRPTGPIIIEQSPFNASTPPRALLEPTTPNDLFFVRNHFPVPQAAADAYRLHIEGVTGGPVAMDLAALDGFPREEVTATFECAGNGRRRLTPQVPGVQWDDTAVGTARWSGVPLHEVLRKVGVPADAVEVAFRGLDRGHEGGRKIPFERSLPVAETLRPEVLLADRMNDEPLTPDHGAPLRLLVPGWYGVASVKWLDRIRFLDEPFHGWFQTERYVYRDGDGAVAGPVDRMRPKALIVDPAADATVAAGSQVAVRGVAWAGTAGLSRVEVSADEGATWHEATLEEPSGGFAACRFAWRYRAPGAAGRVALWARAVDGNGDAQPTDPVWNMHGYGQNGVVPHVLRIA